MYSDDMPSPVRQYAVVAALVVLALYCWYFFLPVTEVNGLLIPGVVGFSLSIFIAPPVAASHLVLWFGWACLLMCRFRAAALCGGGGLAIGLACLFFFPLPPPNYGIYAKLASIAALTVAGVLGERRFLLPRNSPSGPVPGQTPAHHQASPMRAP
jgi:hypothetical protein